MTGTFEMSMMGELKFFLGLQVNQLPSDIFIHQTNYTETLLRKFKFTNAKPAPTPMATTTKLSSSDEEEPADQT
ncbi:Uncharacterized mitochondrial protein AtMg00810 [Linum perenne]